MANRSVDANEAEPLLHLEDNYASSSSFNVDSSTTTTRLGARGIATENDGDKENTRSLAEQLCDDGLSLYEKKCLLINREIDNMGMGRYQWSIWALCGLGYLIDLMWAQAFGLVLSPMQQEMGFGPDQTGKLSTAFSIGLTAGALVWGLLVDIIGRQWVFNMTVLVACAFGTFIAVPSTYGSVLILTALTGFGIGGNIPQDTMITLEFTPQSKRYLLPLLSIFQPLGVVICSIIAYGFIPKYSCSPNFSEKNPLPACSKAVTGGACCRAADNMGWRYLLFTLGGVTLAAFLLRSVIFRFQESPKFLVYRGRDAKAVEVLHNIAMYNGRTCELSSNEFEGLEREFDLAQSRKPTLASADIQLDSTWVDKFKLEGDRFKILFSNYQMTRLTLLVWLTYICDYWGFTVAGSYLPQILALKNGALDLSLSYTYRSYIYIYTPGVFGVLLGTLAYRAPSIGRKWTMVFSSALMAVSIFLFSSVNSAASNTGLNIMEYFFQSMFNSVLYGWTPEAFPAPIRGTACGIASFWGRLFGIISPLIAQHLYAGGESGERDINSVLYLAGSVTLGCVITTALLPNSLLGRQSL
ncbi:MFS general substrate transporter [Plenodomus tracheiphilus IPT5]|uniref:MFS general substrate transporter n=1 Tax=Plenodomus tracheiphilus IPT5 TaxID=1408161 RepID=A0A6A7BNU9_9PLEO|nr:MFS general substrate transporter [Plenodomus tracheiphilus IPT5]